MRSPDVCYERFCQLMDTASKLKINEANEATTRLNIVDEVLELLGWAKADFNPEERTEIGDFSDYLLKSHRNPLVVVEVKRIGKTFLLPQEHRKREYKASFLCSAGGTELKEAMLQAADYCNQQGCSYAVVTNGIQWIIFRGLAVNQKGWTAFPAMVFNDANTLKNQFIEFWNLLSKEKVLQGSLNNRFSEQSLPSPEFAACPNSELPDEYISPKGKEIEGIDVLFSYYFDDIVSNNKGAMLDECFVEDPDIHEFQKELQAILKERLLSLKEDIESEELSQESLVKFVEQPRPDNQAKVVLVVGRVGAGKTTFLQKFFRTLEEKSGYAKYILDLISELSSVGNLRPDEEERLSKLILERISDRYYDKKNFGPDFDPYDGATLRTIYGSLVRRLERGPKKSIYQKNKELFEEDVARELELAAKDTVDLLPKYMRYVTRRSKKPFCLIIDNIDRASDQYQKFIYTFAHKLSRNIEGVIVISLRETTYRYASLKGFFDTRIDKVFQVNPPNLKSVISKRLKYLKYHTNNSKKPWQEVRPYLKELSHLGEHLRKLLLMEDNSARLLITCIANRSIRGAFRLLRQYATSPFAWTEWEKGEAGKHVLRALMLGRFWIYQEVESPIINLFAVPKDVRGSHFLSIKLLAYLNWSHHGGTRLTSSPKVGDIVKNFEDWGIQKSMVMQTLKHLVSTGLLESDSKFITDSLQQSQDEQSLDYENIVRISPSGYFYLNILIQDELYKVYCAGDTTWYSKEHYKKFYDEYCVFVELAHSETNLDLDYNLFNSDCYQHWLSYLKLERVKEESALVGNAKDIAWRSSIVGILDSVVPLGELSVQNQPETTLITNQKPIKSSNKKKAEINKLQPSLFEGLQLTEGIKATKEVEVVKEVQVVAQEVIHPTTMAEKMPTLSENKSYEGARYLPRVLWALKFAKQTGLAGVTASKIAEIITKHGLVQVHPPNVAKFLRNNRKSKNFEYLWEEKHVGEQYFYELVPDGENLYKQIFQVL